MTDKPILFSGPMVRALLEDRKTQTRRVLKAQPTERHRLVGIYAPHLTAVFNPAGGDHYGNPDEDFSVRLPYSRGDRLWVRETFGYGCRPCPFEGFRDGVEYRADEAYCDDIEPLPLYSPQTPDDFCYGDVNSNGWKPSIYMPRWASRITLVVKSVKVERVQDISEVDAIAEGIDWPGNNVECCGSPRVDCDFTPHGEPINPREECCGCPIPTITPIQAYERLWDFLNAKRGYGWEVNPWVSVTEFEVHKGNIESLPKEGQPND